MTLPRVIYGTSHTPVSMVTVSVGSLYTSSVSKPMNDTFVLRGCIYTTMSFKTIILSFLLCVRLVILFHSQMPFNVSIVILRAHFLPHPNEK